MRLGQKSASKNVQKFLRLRRPFTFRVAQIRLVLWNFPNYLQRIARNDCKLRNGSSYFILLSFFFFLFDLTKWPKAIIIGIFHSAKIAKISTFTTEIRKLKYERYFYLVFFKHWIITLDNNEMSGNKIFFWKVRIFECYGI